MAVYTYSIELFPDKVIDPDAFLAELRALGFADRIGYLNTSDKGSEIGTKVDLSADELAAIDDLIGAHKPELSLAKQAKVAAIDQRTKTLIDEGFEFPPKSGQVFSLSATAQVVLLALEAARADPLFAYPVVYSTKDESAVIQLEDSDGVHAFFVTAIGVCRGHLDSGTAIKNEVRAANTVAEVNAIVDPR
jgi:hypothetical protein